MGKVFVKNCRTDADQGNAAQCFGPAAGNVADDAPQHYPQRYHQQGGTADCGGRDQNVVVDESQAHAYSHGVDTGGKARGGQQPEGMPRHGRRFFVTIAYALGEHDQAQKHQQAEGDPVIPFRHELGGQGAQRPPRKRRERLDDAKDDARSKRLGKPGPTQGHALAHGGCKGVG